MNWRIAMVLLAVFGSVQVSAMPSAVQSSSMGQIVVDSRKTSTLQQALSHPEAARLVYVGETHTSYADHQLQLQVLQIMQAKVAEEGRPLALGVEWFQRSFQGVLDRYIAGEIDELSLLEQTEYFSRWRFDYRLYRDIMRYAREHKIPVYALNAERELTDLVRREGLDGMPQEQRRRLPAEYDFDNQGYLDDLQAVFRMHDDKTTEDPEVFRRFLEVQLTWDETMAETISSYLQAQPDGRMLVLAGRGHTHQAAIPKRVTRRTAINGLTIASYQPDSPFGKPDYLVLQAEQSLPPKGLIGVGLEERDEGVFITSISDGSKATEAGIKTGDRITRIAGREIVNYVDVQLAMVGRIAGERLKVAVDRPGFWSLERDLQLDVELIGR